ncbi:glutamyl-tRNA(Gln) amidotransferase (subunit B) [Petrocella atlantisensis]|uniref:Aspartyl/glutamyl-tRNA(Asn/Gln) amidotransferase subunit B n=1 Tax=Petrocella atlantisensis TaxID=2173034 RepID=A0A3P7Q1W0_9FIRM|nr:Asp-tRNA(Asn)/Glu-tRNA(Gln) amidotransferase subunit GatB [Petrocella atlantisensis]VDN49321.1 glutamyl-tRNA(Gln) amidotransferase (subunit B) [Petrocella atlantisensis]
MGYEDYEIVMGLEVHSELKTNTKIFCDCKNEFGGEPNTHCCPICTGMPGTLPVLNGKVVEYAIKAGLATNCKINQFSKQDRKNYFYPDLPKAYQVSQFDLPLCYEGEVEIEVEGEIRKIGITRIHIEEDAGKLNHEIGGTLVDYNRCGIPLIEIVSEPDFRSPVEVGIYMEKLRTILLYADVSDCKMNEGSLRCDVNLSVRKKGEKTLGTRTEMKNINSFSFAVKAAEYEAKRQIKVLESGGTIIQETRRWDEAKGITISMRTKEEAHDYRYFPEPDLMPIITTDEQILKWKASLPVMPDVRKANYIKDYGLGSKEAGILVASRKIADFFEAGASCSKNPKAVANWIISEVYSRLNEDEKEQGPMPIKGEDLGTLVNLIEEGTISGKMAKTVFEKMWQTGKSPATIVDEEGLKQNSDEDALRTIASDVLNNNEKIVADYLGGKEAAIQSLMGQMMKATKGKANPKMVIDLLKELLEAMR